MAQRMTFDFGLGGRSTCHMRKFRWLFKIDGVSAVTGALPPEKSARPSLNFKEIEVQHLNETLFFAGKPEWKPITLTLYDLKKNNNPVFEWIKQAYNPCEGRWSAPAPNTFKKSVARLEMYDGCGRVMETWIYENVWPQSIEWGELDMANSEYVTIELTLRYDRAFVIDGC